MGRRFAVPFLLCGALITQGVAAAPARRPAPRPAAGRPGAATAQQEARRLAELGQAHHGAKRYAEALAAFEGAYRLEPSAILLINMGIACQRLGRTEQSVSYYERVGAEFPQDELRATAESKLSDLRARLSEERGREALDKGRFEEAQDAFRSLYRLRPSWRVLLLLADAQGRGGRHQDAVRSYERALQDELPASERDAIERSLDGARLRVDEERAAQLAAAGQHGEAARLYEAVYRSRRQPALLLALLREQRLAGRFEDALRSAELYLREAREPTAERRELEAGLSELRARALDQRAQGQFQRGARREAFATWDEAYRQAPLPAILFHHARALRLAGDREEALRRFEDCLRVKETLEVGERIETESAVSELRQQLADRKLAAATREQPFYRRPAFLGAMIGVGVLVGGAVVLGVLAGTGKLTPQVTEPMGDLPTMPVTFGLGR